MTRRRLVVSALLAGGLAACSSAPAPVATPTTRASTPASSPAANRSPSAAPGPATSFTLVATGDVLIHQTMQLASGARRRTGPTTSSRYGAVAPIIRGADLAICHFETPVAPLGGPYRGYPSFAVQPQIIPALKTTGFDECSTASNHSLDDGLGGVVRTLDDLDAAGIGHAGTYRSAAESTRRRSSTSTA